MRTSRSRQIGLTVVAVLVTGGLVGCGARMAVPGGQPSPPAQLETGARETTGPAAERQLAVQEKLDRVAAAIDHDGDDQQIPGFAGLEMDVDAGTIDVYWVGEPPERLRRIVAAAPAGTTIEVHPATYDLKAMMAAVDRVFAAYGDDVVAGSPNTEGDGITIEQTADQVTKSPTLADLTAAARMPVTREIGEGAEPADG